MNTPLPRPAAVRARAAALLERLSSGLHERREAISLALLSAVAGESLFLLGPPGVGKSLIARRLKFAFDESRSFEYLMSRFSTPDEIFGPVSIKRLRDDDRYERRTEGYLPGADVVFLDEIWKAGPAIQNALLTVINEKLYRNGDQEIAVRVRGLITASNELPPQGSALSPLWDRFLIRYPLDGVRSNRSFLALITDTEDLYADPVPADLKLSPEELDAWSASIDAIEVPSEVLNTLQVIRHRIQKANERGAMPEGPLELFDRRWKKIVRLLRTSAFLNGRRRVDLMDCFLMEQCLWSRPAQREPLREILAEVIRRHGYTLATGLSAMRAEVDALEAEIDGEIRVRRTVTEDRPLLVDDAYHPLIVDDRSFMGRRIKAAEYRELSDVEEQVVNVYDEENNLRNRLRAMRGPGPHQVTFSHQSRRPTFALETQKVERDEIITRPAHPLLAEHWDRRLDAVAAAAREQRDLLGEKAPPELEGLDDHLFVDATRARIVRANLEEVAGGLDRLLLRVEKARFSYGGDRR